MPIKLSDTLKKLLIAYVAVFVIQHGVDQFAGGNLKSWLALIPAYTLQGRVWQIFTYSFLHSDVAQLILNLLVLAFVGSDLEAIWGTKKFLTYYFYCLLMAGFFYLLIQVLFWNPVNLLLPMVGASGGIYGLLLAFGLLFPERDMLFMMLFPMKAKQFVWILAGVEFLQAVFSGQGGLSALAGLSGMAAGFLFLWLQAKNLHSKRTSQEGARKKNASHLKLVSRDPREDDDKPPRTWH